MHSAFWALAKHVVDLYFGFSITIVRDALLKLGGYPPKVFNQAAL